MFSVLFLFSLCYNPFELKGHLNVLWIFHILFTTERGGRWEAIEILFGYSFSFQTTNHAGSWPPFLSCRTRWCKHHHRPPSPPTKSQLNNWVWKREILHRNRVSYIKMTVISCWNGYRLLLLLLFFPIEPIYSRSRCGKMYKKKGTSLCFRSHNFFKKRITAQVPFHHHHHFLFFF